MGRKYRDWVRAHSTAKRSARAVLNVLADYAKDEDGTTFPGYTTIARDTGLSERTIMRCINSLIEDGHLTRVECVTGRGNKQGLKIITEKGDKLTSIQEENEGSEKGDNCAQKGDNCAKRVTNTTEKGDNGDSDTIYGTVLEPDLEPRENRAREDQPVTPIEPPAPPPLPATNAFGTKLDDTRMRYDDPPTGPKTPPPVPEKTRPRKHERVTSPHIDPRKFKNGFVVAGEGATAVEVYYERFAIGDDKARLSAPLEDDLIAHCPDLDRLRSVIEAYSRTAYKPRNMQLIFDWYAKGITQNGKESARHDDRKQLATAEERTAAIIAKRPELAAYAHFK